VNQTGEDNATEVHHNRSDRGIFINLKDDSFLDDKPPSFGKVIEGMDVVKDRAAVFS
jgi:cyclophilin family peptidyl-prolyl cis-trans isomerase